jgi:adenine-specific DNA methylase
MDRYPKRLIEVDLPIKRISEHAQNEKNLRSGHPWHLHIWWARRPWGACRAVALASLLPAPADDRCPKSFIVKASSILSAVGFNPDGATRGQLQDALLKFVGEYARWELGENAAFRDTARQLVKAAYPGHSPLAFDSFSGYGAIPGEAARLGCDAVASELNPVALLCLRTLLEAVPRQGQELLDKFSEGANFIRREAEKRLGKYYPKHKGKYPIAWLWARTVTCEGPGCGAEVPLISQTTIAKGSRKAWIEITGDKKTKYIHIHIKQGRTIRPGQFKTAGGGHAVCPVPGCGFTTHKSRVKAQGMAGKMGHRLYGVAIAVGKRQGKEYTDSSDEDIAATRV